MGKKKRNDKYVLCKHHRELWYEHILDKLMEGRCEPQEVTERWEKLKQVRR